MWRSVQPGLARPFALALALAVASVARAQVPDATEPSAEAAAESASEAPATEGTSGPASDATPAAAEPAQEPEPEPAAVAISSAETQALRKQKLTAEIAQVTREREDTHRLLPWVVTVTGLVALAVGLSVGIGRTLSCEHSCSTPAWAGWTVVAGTTLGMAGAIWLVRKTADISELDRRRDQLELQLKQVEWNTAALAPPARATLAWKSNF